MTATSRYDHPVRPHHVVTAVLVAHDGAGWLPTTLHAVKTQRRPVQRFVAVDTGSRDGTRQLLERAVGAAAVLSAPRTTGFSAAADLAVSAFAGAPGLASTRSDGGAPVEWIWLLHDDSAPGAATLELMLELADEMPSIAVIGPKLRAWDDHRVLLEVGVTVDRGGRRETGLEPGELDHGQHDGRASTDVLAVSTAGMLVRRDVWDSLGGLDPELPLFRDDLDFGWRANLAGHRVAVCPRAIVYHAEAAASGVRPIDVGTPHRRQLDRKAALRTMLANASVPWLPVIGLRLLIACLVRVVGFFLIKRPFDAWDELRAGVAVFGRPLGLRRARAARKRTRVVPSRQVRTLLAPRGTRLRHYADSTAQRLATVGGSDERADERGFARRVLARPGFLFVAALLVLALVAERHVLGGALYGGSLLPAPVGASDLWRTYTQSWHPTGFGSSVDAPPYLAILAAVATVLFGSARLAVQVLLLGSVPLAGLSAYFAARPLASAMWLRIWIAATYALLPVATGAVSSGRLGTAVVVVLLPLVLTAIARAVLPVLARGAKRERAAARQAGRRWPGARPAWAAALPLAVATAFDPVLYVLLAPLLLVALVVALVRRSLLAVRRVVIVLVVPPALLLPWSARLVHHPALIVSGVGQTSRGLQSARLHPIDVLLLHPGGPGMPPVWLYAVVVLAGLAGLVQLTRPRPAQLGWLLALVGLGGGLLIAHLRVRVPGAGAAVAGWPGTATALIGAGVLMSAAVAGARLRARLAETSFGWRQPLALLIAGAAVATPVAAAALWVAHGTGPVLRAGSPNLLPAFVTDPAASQDEPRTVVLRAATPAGPIAGTDSAGADSAGAVDSAGLVGSAGLVDYALLRDRSPQIGDADLPADPAQVAVVDAAVADLAGGFGQRAATELAHAGVRYVLVPLTGDGGLGARIAAAGGLLPKSTDSGWQVWQVETEAGRVALAVPHEDSWRLPAASGGVGRQVAPIKLPYAPVARLLVLAEAPSPKWRAVAVDPAGRTSVPLAARTEQGMQAFAIPTTGADVVMLRAPDRRADWLVFELVALLVVVAAAVPGGSRAADQRRSARVGAADDRATAATSADRVGANA